MISESGVVVFVAAGLGDGGHAIIPEDASGLPEGHPDPLAQALVLLFRFDAAATAFQFVEHYTWIKSFNIEYFMGIDGVKFRRKVVPGDVLKLHVDVKRGGGKIWKFQGRAMVDGELACEAEFTAMMDLRD